MRSSHIRGKRIEFGLPSHKEWVILMRNIASYFLVILNYGFVGSFLGSSVLAEESIFSWRPNTGAARTLGDEGEISHEKGPWSTVTAPK